MIIIIFLGEKSPKKLRSTNPNFLQMRTWHLADSENRIIPTWMVKTTGMRTLGQQVGVTLGEGRGALGACHIN